MKIVVLQENLTRALTLASKFLPSKSTSLPAVSNFYFSSKEGKLTITTTDLEIAIKITIAGKIDEEGTMLLPAKTGLSLISSLAGEKVTLTSHKNDIVIEGARSKVKLRTENENDFPEMQAFTSTNTILLEKKLVREVQQKVAFAASSDQSRAVLNGVFFEVKDDEARFVATDGFRLSLLKKNSKKVGIGRTLLLPVKVLQLLASVTGGSEDGDIKVSFAENGSQVLFTLPDIQITSRVIEGAFPDYQRIIPHDHSTRVVVDTEELLQAVRFASVLARESSNIIKLSCSGTEMVVSANAPHTGENSVKIPVQIEGEEVSVAFNFRFLLDVLSLGLGSTVVFETGGALSPGVFRFEKETDYTYIVMPVRLQES